MLELQLDFLHQTIFRNEEDCQSDFSFQDRFEQDLPEGFLGFYETFYQSLYILISQNITDLILLFTLQS